MTKGTKAKQSRGRPSLEGAKREFEFVELQERYLAKLESLKLVEKAARQAAEEKGLPYRRPEQSRFMRAIEAIQLEELKKAKEEGRSPACYVHMSAPAALNELSRRFFRLK